MTWCGALQTRLARSDKTPKDGDDDDDDADASKLPRTQSQLFFVGDMDD